MKLVNETQLTVEYWITCDGGGADCGTIEVDGTAQITNYDDQPTSWSASNRNRL